MASKIWFILCLLCLVSPIFSLPLPMQNGKSFISNSSLFEGVFKVKACLKFSGFSFEAKKTIGFSMVSKLPLLRYSARSNWQ